ELLAVAFSFEEEQQAAFSAAQQLSWGQSSGICEVPPLATVAADGEGQVGPPHEMASIDASSRWRGQAGDGGMYWGGCSRYCAAGRVEGWTWTVGNWVSSAWYRPQAA